MEIRRTAKSKFDGLPLDILEVIPENMPVRGIVQIVHGMQEHKERYLHFMQFLAMHGFACIAHDHRGHGKSVLDKKDLGYFYDETGDAIVEDVNDVIKDLQFRYPHVPVFLFGHSMGSLVVRKYLKKYDDRICGLIVCGAVYENKAAKAGLKLVHRISKLKGDRAYSDVVEKISTGSFDRGIPGTQKNRWLSVNEENVKAFNEDELSGFPFTLNGYKNLLKLVIDVYDKEGWQLRNPDLNVLFIAGEEDPVIGGTDEFKKTVRALENVGYHNVSSKLYKNMRHEILNEIGSDHVYNDILNFLEECTQKCRLR